MPEEPNLSFTLASRIESDLFPEKVGTPTYDAARGFSSTNPDVSVSVPLNIALTSIIALLSIASVLDPFSSTTNRSNPSLFNPIVGAFETQT